MKFFFLSVSILFFSEIIFADNIFDSEEYILKFDSYNINTVKKEKIDEIKIKSFQSILKKIVTLRTYNKINKNLDILFVNNFILNMTINQEKIVNNNYFSKIKINFNKDLIINYLIKNKISYVDSLPNKFLLIIFEENELYSNLLSKKNNYYKYLLNSENKIFSKFFLIPNLDFNDRFLLGDFHYKKNLITHIKKLNNKYKTNYQILIHSKKNNNFYDIEIFLIDKMNKYLVDKKKLNKFQYNDIFVSAYYNSFDKWKELNKINTKFTNSLLCKINIGNIHELKFVTNLLKSNRIIKNFELTSIILNENTYNIIFFGNIDVFRKSLKKVRLNLFINNNECKIKLI